MLIAWIARARPTRQHRDQAAKALNQSVDRYARAWMDAWRMRARELPVRCAPSSDDSQRTAAEQAFDALRAEVAGMHRAMRSLPELITIVRPSVDYTETLGAIAKKLEIVCDFLAAIEQHPAVRTTPTQYTQAVAAAGEGLMQKSARELDRATAAAVAERREPVAMIGMMRGQWKQREWLGWTGIAAFILGILISPMFTRVLPFGRNGHFAAFIMRGNRLEAGASLMAAGSPQAWRTLSDATKLTGDNQAALAACREAAGKAKKEQRCALVVTVK